MLRVYGATTVWLDNLVGIKFRRLLRTAVYKKMVDSNLVARGME